jgi:hypothetical protein
MKKYFYFGGLLVILALSVVVFGQTQVFESLRLRGTGTPGTLVVANDKNDAMIILRGSDGQISSGGNGTPGKLRIANAQNDGVISLDGETGRILSGGNGVSGKLRIANSQNAFVVSIDGDTGRLSFIGNGGIRFPDGTVQTTAPIQGVSLQTLVQRIQQLEQRLQQVEQRVAALSGGGTSPGRHIAVSKEGAGASTVFVVTGTGFTPNKRVVIRITSGETLHIEEFAETAGGDGRFVSRHSLPCVSGGRFTVTAFEDANPQETFANAVDTTCP